MQGTRSATLDPDEELARRRATSFDPASGRGARRATAHPLLGLQRKIGNRATVTALAGPTLQRAADEDVLEEGLDSGFETNELLSGQIANWSSLGGIEGGAYVQGNANTSTATGGLIGSGAGEASALYGAITGGMRAGKGQKVVDAERQAGRGKQATARTGKRDVKTGAANAVQSSGEFIAGGFEAASQVSQIMANAGSQTAFAGANNLLGGIGGVIALPFATLTTLRTGRKAYKQYKRFAKLRKNVEDPKTSASKATKAFEAQKEALQALRDTKQDAEAELAEANMQLSSAKGGKANRKYEALVDARRNAVAEIALAIEDAEREIENTERAKQRAEEELAAYEERAAQGKESPADIKAYALRKNQAGFAKKIIGTVSGVLSIGGGVAGTIAAFAGAAATVAVGVTSLATPIGWALCGAAAVAGLAMAGYAFWKWASKRYDRLVKEGGAEKGFKTWVKAINPFYKKIPSSHRQHMAERLYELAKGRRHDPETEAARGVLSDLGLDWAGLTMRKHPEASVKLIYDKMAS